MIKLRPLLLESVNKLSYQEASDRKLFGPIYHGTNETNRDLIDKEGFKIFQGHERSGNVSHGYEVSDYFGGIPTPIHHLGFGVYFTTVLSIAKNFNNGTTKSLKIYYIDPRQKTINFGSPHTMMKWWKENGYDYNKNPQTSFGGGMLNQGMTDFRILRGERLRATINMTNYLKQNYDLVWFKGKGLYRLLDGDQVCVYDPSRIYQIDKSLIKSGEIGSKVISSIGIDPYNRGVIKIPMGTKGIILKKYNVQEFLKDYPQIKWLEGCKHFYDIKWDKGGRMYQVLDKWIKFL